MNRDRILTVFTLLLISIIGLINVKIVSADSSIDEFEEYTGRYFIEGKFCFFFQFFN